MDNSKADRTFLNQFTSMYHEAIETQEEQLGRPLTVFERTLLRRKAREQLRDAFPVQVDHIDNYLKFLSDYHKSGHGNGGHPPRLAVPAIAVPGMRLEHALRGKSTALATAKRNQKKADAMQSQPPAPTVLLPQTAHQRWLQMVEQKIRMPRDTIAAILLGVDTDTLEQWRAQCKEYIFTRESNYEWSVTDAFKQPTLQELIEALDDDDKAAMVALLTAGKK